MDITNLGLIFAHSVFRKENETISDMMDNMKKNQDIFDFLVSNFEKIYNEQNQEAIDKLKKNKSWRKTLKKSIRKIKHEMSDLNPNHSNNLPGLRLENNNNNTDNGHSQDQGLDIYESSRKINKKKKPGILSNDFFNPANDDQN